MTKYAGHQATLAMDFAGGTSYTTIGQVVDVTGPSISRTAIDTTTRDNTDNYWRTFIRGMKDAGELTFTVMTDTALATHGTASGLYGDFNQDGTVFTAVQITLPNAGTWTFDSFATAASESTPLDDAWTTDFTFKISGKPILA